MTSTTRQRLQHLVRTVHIRSDRSDIVSENLSHIMSKLSCVRASNSPQRLLLSRFLDPGSVRVSSCVCACTRVHVCVCFLVHMYACVCVCAGAGAGASASARGGSVRVT